MTQTTDYRKGRQETLTNGTINGNVTPVCTTTRQQVYALMFLYRSL